MKHTFFRSFAVIGLSAMMALTPLSASAMVVRNDFNLSSLLSGDTVNSVISSIAGDSDTMNVILDSLQKLLPSLSDEEKQKLKSLLKDFGVNSMDDLLNGNFQLTEAQAEELLAFLDSLSGNFFSDAVQILDDFSEDDIEAIGEGLFSFASALIKGQ